MDQGQITLSHQILGTITLFVVLTAYVLDGLPWYEAPRTLTYALIAAFLILLGFGGLVESIVVKG